VKENFLKILNFIKPYRRNIILAIFLTIFLTCLNLLPPLIMKFLIDNVISKKNWNFLAIVMISFLLVPVLGSIISFFNNYTISKVAQNLVFDMRVKMYKHLLKLSLKFHSEMQTGTIVSRIMSDVGAVQNLVTVNTISIVTDIASFLFALIVIFYLSWKLSILLIIILPLYVLNYLYFSKKIRWKNILFWKKMDEISGMLQEKISGIQTVKSFAREEAEINRFLGDTKKSLEYSLEGATYNLYFTNFAQLISGFGTTIIFCLGCYFVLKGEMTYGGVSAFLAYSFQLFNPALRFTEISNQFQQTMVSVSRIFEIISKDVDIKEKKNAKEIEIKGEVKFENVNFGYNDEELVLKNFDLYVKPGTTVALVGPTGCGKSTVINLLQRFYDVKSGAIYIDGEDIRNLKINSLRTQIGVVLQDPFLFNTTIKENIKYGKKTATDEEIETACKISEIYDFIQSLPKKFDTIIGPGGVKLSVGEKQRLAIARAIITNPKILIMDEATASLDSESEFLIQKALEKVLKGRTSFIIAHRLSTIINADLIVVMDKGRIIEAGTHQELLKIPNGFYRSLYEKQFADLLADVAIKN
jgi:subfamily B ATP-binding cassette protein MsbA